MADDATTTTSQKPTKTTFYPLTTQFKPAASCSSEYWLGTILPDFTPDAVLVNGPPPAYTSVFSNCWPPGFSQGALSTWYSPGICPSGWTTASQSYISRTMYGYCCLDGYKLIADQLPQSLLPKSISQDDFTRDDNDAPVCFQALTAAIAVDFTDLNGEILTTDLRQGHSVIHYPVRVKYMASDFSKFPLDAQPTVLAAELQKDLAPYIRSGLVTIASETGTQTTSETGTTSTGSSAVSSNTTDDNNGPDNTLSQPKKGNTTAIAIGVVVGVVVILAVAGFLFFWRRKKRRQQTGAYPGADGPYKQHQNNDSHIGGIQDWSDAPGGIALAETGNWSKAHQ
ncbi:hypothetical protein TWF694_007291 [Orbilia ellipsospora]|uniref:Uncharacterized protein n=1 Tax=Orbilia ellipsospora TaxID=2528407 RepID=A0AAV9XIQ6_9PEZI